MNSRQATSVRLTTQAIADASLDVTVQVHHLVPQSFFTGKFGLGSDQLKVDVALAHQRLKDLGIDPNERQNLIALFTDEAQLAAAKTKIPDFDDWANTAVHSAHVPAYYDTTATRIKDLPPGATKQDVLDLMDNLFDDIKDGRLSVAAGKIVE